MYRSELIAYLEHKADAFEGHPVHVDMSDALREAVRYLKNDDIDEEPYEAIGTASDLERMIMSLDPETSPFMDMHSDWKLDELTPSPPSNGPLPRVPDDK